MAAIFTFQSIFLDTLKEVIREMFLFSVLSSISTSLLSINWLVTSNQVCSILSGIF